MSTHRMLDMDRKVSIHCDGCDRWGGSKNPSAQRRRDGWMTWVDAFGHTQHACPSCAERQAKKLVDTLPQ